MNLNHYGFDNKEFDKERPKDLGEPLSENTEEEDLEFVSSSLTFEINHEGHEFETINTTQIDHDQINITEGQVMTASTVSTEGTGGPIEMDLNHFGFDNEEKNHDQEGPKDLKEPLSENLEEEDFGFVNKISRKSGKKISKFKCLFCNLGFKEKEEFHNHD